MTHRRRVLDRRVADHRHERARREVVGLRGRVLAPHHRLRGEDDHRPVLAAERVLAQQVEVAGRGRRLGHGECVTSRQREEAFDPRRRVVRTLPLVAVREQQHDTGLLLPLRLTGRDELVDDGLRAVDEVAELRLPERQRLRPGDGVAVLEAHGGVLRQQRVVDVELRLVGRQVGQRGPLGGVLAVDDRREAADEGAASRVLTGQPDRSPLHEQRSERQDLAGAPVDRAVGDRRCATLQLRQHLRVHREAVGWRHVRLGDPLQDLAGDCRVGRAGGDRALGRVVGHCDVFRQLVRVGLVLGVAHLGEHPLELLLVVLQRRLGLLDRDVATTDERLGVELADRALLLDQVVHERLGVRRVVALVVTATAVADQVDDDVLVERLAVLERQLRHPDARLGVVAVDVEDRCLHHPRHVGAVERRARRGRRRGEADLVVDDDVDRAAGAVAAQLREVQRLGHDTLARESRVTVHEQRQHRVCRTLVEQILLGARDALEHRVDGLEVRRVRRDRDLDLAAVAGDELALGAEVVLHVTGALDRARVDVALELAEDLRVALADDVGEHVEPAAVGHARW